MAATDQTYRSQKALDVVFAVSGILMLLSLVWMFAADYFREFKTEQRRFRDVETAMAERDLLRALPLDQVQTLSDAEKAAKGDGLNQARKAYYEARKPYLEAQDKLIALELQARLDQAKNGNDHKEELQQAKDAVKEARAKVDAVIQGADENVQTALKAEDALLDYLDRFRDARRAVRDAQVAAEQRRKDSENAVQKAQVALAQADGAYRSIKADYDSKESLFYIAVDERDHMPADRQKDLNGHIQSLRDDLDRRRKARDDAKDRFDAAKEDLHRAETDKAFAEALQTLEEGKAKDLQKDVERYQKLVKQKQWKATDWLLSQPVIDAFASPYRIQQYTLNEYPIDYSFKYVTRYDRCTTCHEGMEKGAYEKPALRSLVKPPKTLQDNLTRFRQVLTERRNRKEDVPPDTSKGDAGGINLDDLPDQVMSLSPAQLTDARVTQFCAHPRLDLFVDSNSPHPVEKFGCTSCHGGQGSATDFRFAAHAPNSPRQKEVWEKDHDWFPSEFWDFPMYPKRFEESTCLKCHHEVTDLVRYGNQVEAPKLVRGYNLVRDNGCFGCHEIAGTKRGREIGPDLRLEPTVPLDKMDPAERAKTETDRDNPPGSMRKVGPSLFRLSEKTNREWVERWIYSPRGFRPSTRMPHFYGLSNNHPDTLAKAPDQASRDQADFPSGEVRAIAYYLMEESGNYLKGEDAYRRANRGIVKYYQDREKKQGSLSEAEKKELKDASDRLDPLAAPLLELRLGKNDKPRHVADKIVDGEGNEVKLPDAPKDADGQKKERERGRRLFSERGCLACHQHEGTTKPSALVPAVVSQADFGPDLSHVAAKLGDGKGNEAARRWLVQWILNPQAHHPRTRMPYTHLNPEDAAAVAAWLLSEGKDWKGEEVPDLANPLKTYKQLAQLYLSKVRNPDQVMAILELEDERSKSTDPAVQDRLRQIKTDASIWLDGIRPDSDEAILQGGITEEKAKLYVGRKAISRLGCFGCHNVPGFETAKPIGTPLNDWGKKDPERLAFEDIGAYVREHHTIVEHRDDPKDPARPSKEWSEAKEGKSPYEQFFYEELHHHQRDGFLNQKLREPRSYDYHRQRVWDDRLRMPQFKFSHSPKRDDEDDETYAARREQEEAEAREAVMTFVLGLVAEPVPAQYLNQPSTDRLAEAKGRKLVEQFNCVGCHEVRPGVYEFKPTPEQLARLEEVYGRAAKDFGSDFGVGKDPAHDFVVHNSWKGPAPPWPDHLLAYGIGYHKEQTDEGDRAYVRLAEALHFEQLAGHDKQERDIPANTPIPLPDELLTHSDTLGGAFSRIMIPYLNKKDGTQFKIDEPATGDSYNARSVLPPQLFREGERTQPEWLFQFLRNPSVIRPEGYMLLRMPKFNISDDEARTLVNYFNAHDKISNPGIGLTYPYLTVPERNEDYWLERSRQYVERLGPDKLKQRAEQLKPLWEEALKDQLTELERKLSAAKDLVEKTKAADEKKTAEANRDAVQKEYDALKKQVDAKDVAELEKKWAKQGVYLADAYRLLANSGSPCLECHQAGDVAAKGAKGPNLRLSAERLRPGWTERWLGNPIRLMQPTIMPQNFPRDKEKQYNEVFEGTPLDRVEAVRDVLLNFPQVADRPENHYYRSGPAGGK
jgi:mono/diheme cytochrome c family protein